jgi:hypothetical protein
MSTVCYFVVFFIFVTVHRLVALFMCSSFQFNLFLSLSISLTRHSHCRCLVRACVPMLRAMLESTFDVASKREIAVDVSGDVTIVYADDDEF